MSALPLDRRCGRVAIVGRPNTGKSTLLNRLLTRKCSITSSHPQTTRCRVSGVKSNPAAEIVYTDTPGMQSRRSNLLSRYMRKEVLAAIYEAELIVFMVEALRWNQEDQFVLELLRQADVSPPRLLAVNKIDRVRKKDLLLPYIQQVTEQLEFCQVIPLAARTGQNVELLESCIEQSLEAAPMPPAGDKGGVMDERFLATELLREKLLRRLRDELPYRVAVEMERFFRRRSVVHIYVSIWVESEGQKGILIGRGGEMLKLAGQQTRKELECILGKQVNLKTWVKVEKNWSNDNHAMLRLGYG